MADFPYKRNFFFLMSLVNLFLLILMVKLSHNTKERWAHCEISFESP